MDIEEQFGGYVDPEALPALTKENDKINDTLYAYNQLHKEQK